LTTFLSLLSRSTFSKCIINRDLEFNKDPTNSNN